MYRNICTKKPQKQGLLEMAEKYKKTTFDTQMIFMV